MDIEIFRHNPDNRVFMADLISGLGAQAYCDCSFAPSAPIGFKGSIHELITCRCGEDEGHSLSWVWEKQALESECVIVGPNVTFHPTYSQGTAVIRSETPLEMGMIHYWEIKILTSLSGTETMIGIGTDKVNLHAHRFRFTSALGLDEQSWGYSFRGKSQYNGQSKYYGKSYSAGCLVGVFLDLSRGRMEFYLNRRPLGIAFKNIPTDPSAKIYAMACSTAANSSIRLINATSCPDNLQFQCMRVVAKNKNVLDELNAMPGLKYLTKRYWFLMPSLQYETERRKNNLSLEDEAICRTQQLKRTNEFDQIENFDLNDLYVNAHMITHRRPIDIDSDDEMDPLSARVNDFLYFLCEH